MKFRWSPRALKDAKRLKTWWRRHRPKAPDLFEEELSAALRQIGSMPTLGSVYEQGEHDESVEVRRLLMPKTRNYIFYVVEGAAIVRVVCVWGGPKERGPKL
jgi:plasmid stabilization system protein ParE